MRLHIERKIKGTMPHLYEGGWLWASQGNAITRTRDLGVTWEPVASLYDDPARRLLSSGRISARLSRHGCFGLYRLPDGTLLATTGSGPRILPPGSAVFQPLEDHPIDFRPMRRGVLSAPDEEGVFIGAYRLNGGEARPPSGRDPVELFHFSSRTSSWSTRFAFPRDTHRHIHAVLADPFVSNQLWLCTGDTDTESIIYRSTDGLRTLIPFAACGQMSRTCDLLFTQDALIWGVDSPLHASSIVRMPRQGGPVETLCDTPAPVYYACTNERGHCFFSTTVEPGPAVRTSHTEIYASLNGIDFEPVHKRRSDPSPQFAQTHFPTGVLPGNYIVWSSVATLRFEGTLCIGRLET